jgi:hypothetical protein
MFGGSFLCSCPVVRGVVIELARKHGAWQYVFEMFFKLKLWQHSTTSTARCQNLLYGLCARLFTLEASSNDHSL